MLVKPRNAEVVVFLHHAVGRDECARDHLEQRGLPRTIWPHQRDAAVSQFQDRDQFQAADRESVLSVNSKANGLSNGRRTSVRPVPVEVEADVEIIVDHNRVWKGFGGRVMERDILHTDTCKRAFDWNAFDSPILNCAWLKTVC